MPAPDIAPLLDLILLDDLTGVPGLTEQAHIVLPIPSLIRELRPSSASLRRPGAG